MKMLIQSIRMLVVVTLLTGIAYPLAMTGFAQLVFPRQARGSLLRVRDKEVGSELLAQKFEDERYFWPRPSSADYATVPSGASNKGPTSADLQKAIETQRAKFGANAPIDLLTASASGLDPHISPEAATLQIARVAAARNVPNEQLSALIAQATQPPQFGMFGEPRVNVLRLNLLLDDAR